MLELLLVVVMEDIVVSILDIWMKFGFATVLQHILVSLLYLPLDFLLLDNLPEQLVLATYVLLVPADGKTKAGDDARNQSCAGNEAGNGETRTWHGPDQNSFLLFSLSATEAET